ncbi:hypothetical protein [Paenibacillus sp. ACRRY]|uniref:hypothetical protein n=1 Tax=Paenibacillus sp. ACRRY TaxID=2918208 RepID=UPI001EF40DB9|nr:hypothetical protein [Paenibacillus sp. ACRRY]MCG7383354.1 hypothetical protein [Paenibacillus sp. ACRRY]
MAKLNVVIPAVEVTVGDVTYRKVERKAQAGDIIRFDSETDVEEITSGGFYAVNRIDSFGDARITDDYGDDDYDTAGEDFDVYAPVNESTPETITFQGAKWRKVDRDVREGDAIKFTDEDRSSYVTESELYVVNYVDSLGDPEVSDDDGDDYDAGSDDYEVYEKVAVSTPQYREVKRKANVGERIKTVEEQHGDYHIGTQLTVINADRWGDGTGVSVKEVGAGLFHREYVVLEPVNAEPTKKAERLAVGDYARFVRDGATVMRTGDIVEILVVDSSDVPYRTKRLADGAEAWTQAVKLVHATEQEVAAAKRAALIAQFSVGDSVKLTVEDGKRPRFGYASVSNGDIGKVTRTSGDKIIVDFPTHDAWMADPTELTKLTAEEVAEIERKQAEEAKWAAIGRKVNEIKAGDVVQTYKEECGHPVGTVGIASRSGDASSIEVKVDGKMTFYHFVKLIVPVEQRFDTKEVDAA